MKKSFNILRFCDVILSLLGLLILCPVLIFVAGLIRLESKKILFKQERIGILGKSFIIYKFRTMNSIPGNDSLLTVDNDSRITRSGNIIRRMKLDEIPQLVNVIKGDMSIVGPRPEVRKYVETYTEEQKIVLTVKPGITDMASVFYRNEAKILSEQADPDRYYREVVIPKKIDLNMRYINRQNLRTYFTILFKTIVTLFHSNA